MAKADPEPDASDGKTNSRLAHACARAEDANRREGQKRQRSANDMKLRGGRGFNSFRSSCPATAPILMRRFFSWPELLIFFKRNQVFQTLDSKFLRRNKADRSASHCVRVFIFSPGPGQSRPKICREIPGGGGGCDDI